MNKFDFALVIVDGVAFTNNATNITEQVLQQINGLPLSSINKTGQTIVGANGVRGEVAVVNLKQVLENFSGGAPLVGISEPETKSDPEDNNPLSAFSSDSQLERAKLDCAQLFKKGTKDYANCVMKLLD